MTQQLAATERQRAALESQPLLAPARNRLIGRWQSATSRPAANAVFGLPAKGSIFNLLPFEFETPNRIHLIGVTCTLVRANATPEAGRGNAAPAAPAARSGGLQTIKDRVAGCTQRGLALKDGVLALTP